MTTKEDFAHALGTLLCLDRVMISDLMRLKPETLAKMYHNYIQNAKDSNNKLEEVVGAIGALPKRASHKQKLRTIYAS
jgi:hypothetical protein